MLRKGKSIVIENRLLTLPGTGGRNWAGGGRELFISGDKGLYWRNENILKLFYTDDCTTWQRY